MGYYKAHGGLGFRYLVCFNNALLAKQCWRLLYNFNVLVAKILMAIYYSNDTFLDGSLGKLSSLSWRSIWLFCNLLKARLIWKIDDDKSVKIWKDK